jgi:hypothetical protein
MGIALSELPAHIQEQIRAKSLAPVSALRQHERPVAPVDEYDSKLERKFAGLLRYLQTKGDFHRWMHEPFKLKLAKGTFYTPDFATFVQLSHASSMINIFEVKGFWRDDARVKFKVAAAQYPEFQFVSVQWDRQAKCWIMADTKGNNWKEAHHEA